MNNYKVYKHTSPSGKVYIGITRQDPIKRWQRGYGYIDNQHFFSAIRLYGWDNFTHEILFDNLTAEDAVAKEIELIAFYDSTDKDKGYNRDLGGGYRSEQSIEKGVASWHKNGNEEVLRQKIKDHWADTQKAMQHRAHLSEALNREDVKEKLSENMRKRMADPEYREKALKRMHDGRKNISKEAIAEQGRRHSRYRKEHPERFANAGRPRKPVLQKDAITGEVIKVWESAREASRGIGCGMNSVSTAINSNCTLYGFRWEYLETKEGGV